MQELLRVQGVRAGGAANAADKALFTELLAQSDKPLRPGRGKPGEGSSVKSDFKRRDLVVCGALQSVVQTRIHSFQGLGLDTGLQVLRTIDAFPGAAVKAQKDRPDSGMGRLRLKERKTDFREYFWRPAFGNHEK